MVIGGQAVLLYGEPRLTRDIDITLGVDLERLDDVINTAAAAGLESLVEPRAFTPQTMVFPCQDLITGIRVDFIFSFTPYGRQAINRSRAVPVGTVAVRFASPEDLIIHKVVAGRPRDLEDVRSVLMKNPTVDLAYIYHWLREFAAALGEPFGERFDQLVEDSR